MILRKLREWLSRSTSNTIKLYTATKCGHQTERSGVVTAFDRTTTTEMPIQKDGSIDYCLECIGKMAIQCAWCSDPIFIGDPITLYSPREKGFEVPEHAVIYSDKPLQLVGCFGWNCAQTGADRAGFWLPDENRQGHVQRVPTAYEMIMESGGNKGVIISDLGDISEAMKPKRF